MYSLHAHLTSTQIFANRVALIKIFYWLFQVKYHSYLDAFKVAKAEDKLVHFIMLWGALDDQSC